LDELPHKVNKLICEGTTISRNDFRAVMESELEDAAVEEFRKTNGPVFILQSSTNIDRIVTMYRAAKRSERLFLQELYMAEITSAIGRNIPNPSFDDVYAFITAPSRYDGLLKYRNRIGKSRISSIKYVMCVRSSMTKYLKSLSEMNSFNEGILIYSMWEGYKDKKEIREFLEECKSMGLRVINLHTTGHADSEAITKLIERTNPDKIYPVHTEDASWFDRFNHCSEVIKSV
jgi:ribonuclease J